MKTRQIRLKPSTEKWIEEQAGKEGITFSAMLRTLLERLEYEDFIRKQLENRKRKEENK